jgi:hypothetical protein
MGSRHCPEFKAVAHQGLEQGQTQGNGTLMEVLSTVPGHLRNVPQLVCSCPATVPCT